MAVIEMPHLGTAPTKPTGPILPDVIASEWTKIRTVRSTYWTLFAAAFIMIGISVLICLIVAATWGTTSAKNRLSFDPVGSTLGAGAVLAQLAIAVLGVLVITSEYNNSMIRSTFAAVPQRLTVFAAKAGVFAVVTFVVTTTASLVAFLVGQAILSTASGHGYNGIGVGLGSPGALREVIGTGMYMAVLGLLALSLGTIIRKTAGAITAVVGMVFILPILASLLPGSMNSLQKFLPSSAGEAFFNTAASSTNVLSPWVGFGVFCLWAVIGLTVAGALLVRRDA
jgi:ABC-2 type transport system permease protein